MGGRGGAPVHSRQFLSVLKLLRDDLRQMIDSGTSVSVTVPDTPQAWIAPLRHRFASLFDALDMQSDWQGPAARPQAPRGLHGHNRSRRQLKADNPAISY